VRLRALGLIGASGGLAVALSLVLSSWIVRPVRRLTAAADAMKEGALTTRSGIEREDEIGRLARSFDLMAASLEELDRLKGEFVAHVSHELRTPLTAMQLAVANLQDGVAGPVDGRQMEVLRRIGGDIDRLIRLVHGVLDAARIDAGRLELDRAPLDLAEVANAAVSLLEPLAREKGVELLCEAGGSPIEGDREKLLQVATNLVHNAIKFTAAGGSVRVQVRRGTLVVADTGCGIAPELRPRIFDRFARAGAVNAGAGLGLSICRKIVELHGGSVSVRSAPGEGSTFTVSLPCRDSSL
jgi:two-component system sensor histidine kinase BaeS